MSYSSKEQKVDESVRALVLAYISAKNREDFAQAELILHEIKQIRRLVDEH